MDKQVIDTVIRLEWELFQKVNNIGGRASCQDEYDTFEIMRKSQFLSWDDEVTESYLQDLQESQAEGRNLVAEKYLRMMKSTDPVNYTKSAHLLPVLPDERIQKQEEVIAREIRWAEEYAQQYPLVSRTNRVIYTHQDTLESTSVETYLRGELGTYSDRTFALYKTMTERLEKEGKNLVVRNMEYTAKLYGYEGIEDLENRMRRKQA